MHCPQEVKAGAIQGHGSLDAENTARIRIDMRVVKKKVPVKKKNIKLDVYRNLVINTPNSKLSTMVIAKEKSMLEMGGEKKPGTDVEAIVSHRGEGPKTDLTLQWNPDNPLYMYNDRNYAILPDVPSRFRSSSTAEIYMNSLFFSCFCVQYFNGTRKLILQGDDLEPRIGRRIQDLDIPRLVVFLQSNKDVVSLNLAYNRIHCPGFMNLINYITVCSQILELNVQNNLIGYSGIDYLYQRGEKLRLNTLRLNGNKIGVEGAKKIGLMLLKNPHLRCLDVAEVDQNFTSLAYFTTVLRWDQQSRFNQTLRMLDLSSPNPSCMYHGYDPAHFANIVGCMLRFNKCLFELHLQKYSFSCHDIEIMVDDMRYNNTLHLLDLSNNNIGDHGIQQIAEWLKKRPQLKVLLLGHNIITSVGASAMSFCLPFSRIRILDLPHNRITDSGVIDILNSAKKSTFMRHLGFFGNCIGHQTAKIVERMLVSGVLIQENLDVKPYRVDHMWYLACYPANHYNQRYYNIPCQAFPEQLKPSYCQTCCQTCQHEGCKVQ